MKNKLLSADFALIAMWGILLLTSPNSTASNKLIFDFSIHVHIAITGALIAFRMIYKRRNLLNKTAN